MPNQRNANRLKQKGTKSLAAWDFKSKDGPKEVPMAAFDNIPRQTEIMGQPHMLSYINPQEEALLRRLGGSGVSGPGGVPSYITWDDVVSFFSGDSGGTPTTPSNNNNNNNNNNNSSVPVYDNYYDAIDAEGVGATVNIGGKIVKAETADGYTGSGSNTNTSTATDYSFLDADEEEDYNLGTGTDYSTAYDPFKDDDKPATTTTNYDASSEVTPFTTGSELQSVVRS